MILSDKDIRLYIEKGINLIEPFEENSLQSESFDLSIGNTFSKYNADFKIVDLENQVSIDNAYTSYPLPPSGYILGPKEYILVSIAEKITLPENITAHVRPRTKFTRIGLIVSNQHCNSSYSGNLNLGLLNVNPFAIVIHSGMKIAQIVFEELKSVPTKNKQYNGSYQNEDGTEGALFNTEISTSRSALPHRNNRFKNDVLAQSAFTKLMEGLEK